jgi:hypothetical protein
MFAAYIGGSGSAFLLLEDTDNFLLAESTLSHYGLLYTILAGELHSKMR